MNFGIYWVVVGGWVVATFPTIGEAHSYGRNTLGDQMWNVMRAGVVLD